MRRAATRGSRLTNDAGCCRRPGRARRGLPSSSLLALWDFQLSKIINFAYVSPPNTKLQRLFNHHAFVNKIMLWDWHRRMWCRVKDCPLFWEELAIFPRCPQVVPRCFIPSVKGESEKVTVTLLLDWPWVVVTVHRVLFQWSLNKVDVLLLKYFQ